MRTLGPRYGKLLGGIRNHLMNGDGTKIAGAVKNGGTYTFSLDGQEIALKEEDLLIEPKQREGYAVETDGGLAVILDTELTPELIEEGYVREIISKVQTMRKEAGFEVVDHIRLSAAGNEKILAVMEKNKSQIAGEVLADSIELGSVSGYQKEWDINGEKTSFGVEKLG